ncbi:hypothetical protein [Propionispira raffinosivorans]|uniref:hypothetical protein n=1 Tax=Propionispira raffinosivorans TaxID=86959 RepID=UPI000527261F|nr:hypothetical protein [Propionispira raffinosivorans]
MRTKTHNAHLHKTLTSFVAPPSSWTGLLPLADGFAVLRFPSDKRTEKILQILKRKNSPERFGAVNGEQYGTLLF